MKNHLKYYFYLFIACFSFSLMSCEKDFEEVSRITTYATFDMAGDEVIAVPGGGSFTDPGVKAFEGSTELNVTQSIQYAPLVTAGDGPSDAAYQSVTSVDASKPGLYTISYSATNSDGFSASTERLVFVFPGAIPTSVNIAGNYTSGTSPAPTITKVTDGVFFSTNAWGGGSSVVIPAYIMAIDGNTLSVPQQDSRDRIYGYGTIAANGDLNMFMSRPSFPPAFGGPLLDLVKNFVKQ